MTRKERFPDTRWFRNYNRNPHHRVTGDCVYRAISTALDEPYNDVVMDAAQFQCETGFCVSTVNGMTRFLKKKGFVQMPQPHNLDGTTKLTGEEFCQYLNRNAVKLRAGNAVVCNIGANHTSCVVYVPGEGYKFHDIWNCTANKVGIWWRKQ